MNDLGESRDLKEDAEKEKFIAAYCARSGVTWEWLSQFKLVVKCECFDTYCEGWAMIPKEEPLTRQEVADKKEERDSIAWSVLYEKVLEDRFTKGLDCRPAMVIFEVNNIIKDRKNGGI